MFCIYPFQCFLVSHLELSASVSPPSFHAVIRLISMLYRSGLVKVCLGERQCILRIKVSTEMVF